MIKNNKNNKNIIINNNFVLQNKKNINDEQLKNENNNILKEINLNEINLNENNNIEQINKIEDNKLKNNIITNKEIILDEINNNIFLKELLTKQIKNITPSKKLNYNDIKRISKFISTSIFNDTKCALWNGYVTNEKNQSKGTYVNFYFNKKKIALHRLLYINYIGTISNNEYIKFSCTNKGKCCNVNHMNKYTYINVNNIKLNKNLNNETDENLNNDLIHINLDKKKLIVEL